MCEKITMDKQYRTKSGHPVRILAIDVKNDYYPVMALVLCQPNREEVYFYSETGQYRNSCTSPTDLIEYNPAMDWELGQPIMVRDNEQEDWFLRIYIRYIEGEKKPFIAGFGPWNDEFTKTAWKEARLPTKDELKTYIKSPKKILTYD